MPSRSKAPRGRQLVRHWLPSRQSEGTADGEGRGDEAVHNGLPILPPFVGYNSRRPLRPRLLRSGLGDVVAPVVSVFT